MDQVRIRKNNPLRILPPSAWQTWLPEPLPPDRGRFPPHLVNGLDVGVCLQVGEPLFDKLFSCFNIRGIQESNLNALHGFMDSDSVTAMNMLSERRDRDISPSDRL